MIHSIRPLVDLLPPTDPLVPRLLPLVRFSAYAYAYRYPSFSAHEPTFEPPVREEVEAWLADLEELERYLVQELGLID